MRIMSPPKFIMNISLIMRLIIALIVFQCVAAAGASATRLRARAFLFRVRVKDLHAHFCSRGDDRVSSRSQWYRSTLRAERRWGFSSIRD